MKAPQCYFVGILSVLFTSKSIIGDHAVKRTDSIVKEQQILKLSFSFLMTMTMEERIARRNIRYCKER